MLPPSLSEREKLLILSCWQQWDAAGVPGSALSQWLVGIDVDSGPDGRNSATYLKQNFDAQEAADLHQDAHLHTMEDLGDNPCNLLSLSYRAFASQVPHDEWNEAVRWHDDTKLAATIQNEAELADAKIILSKLEKVVVEAESRHGVVVWSSTQNCPTTIPAHSYPLQLIVVPGEEIQRHLPETLHVEATGLGDRDLLYPIPWDISIRSDKEPRNVLWTDSMNLVWNLLMGGRMGRYTGSPDTLVFDQRIDLRGFSAGSFAGLSTLHLLWQMPNVVTNGKLGAIACPPQLIVTPPTDHTLHLLHYEADQLCVWKPGGHQLDQLQIRYTYVSIEGPAYKEHFGTKEHNYSHWLSLNHTAGWWDLARFLFMNPEAASSAKRDATPLRLLSWLSFRLEPAVEKLVEATMLYLSTVNEVKDSELLELGRMHLEVDTPFVSAEALRDHLIELMSVRNLRHRPEALFALFRQFLQRLSLPRICHYFLDGPVGL